MRLNLTKSLGKQAFCAITLLLILCSIGLTAGAQTTLISPTGDGGFESGSTFSANGWTVVNGTDSNQWFVGSTATASAGSNSAYISNNAAGTTYNYLTSTSASSPATAGSVVHFYRDVTFPAGETNILLSFKWKAGGESTWDYLTVYSMPTTVTPVFHSPAPTTSSSWNNIPTVYSGAVVHSSPPNLNLQSSSYQTQTICLPASYAGTTRRLVFMWSNDGSGGVQPPASVDEISLVTSVPTAPVNSPTALSLAGTTSTITGSFTAASSSPSGYLVVAYPTGATPVNPVNGTTYTAGTVLGTGRVVSVGSAVTFTASGLTPSTSYTFYVYSYNNTTCSGPYYKATSPLTGTQTTLSCSGGLSGTYSVGPTGTYSTLTAAVSAANNTGVTANVILELQPTYTSSTETFPITFSNNVCVTTQTITLRPQSTATGLSITSSNTTATVDINGASNIIIDGRPGGSGTASQLTIGNTSTSGVAARFINDANNNTVKYTSLQGVNTSTTSGVVLFSTTTGSNGNDNNTIDNCDIRDGASTPTNGIYSAGTTTTTTTNNSNNTISNNRISNFFSASSASGGIKIEGGNTDWTVSNNTFFQSASRTHTSGVQHSAIWINNTSGNNFLISGNTIGYATSGATGTYTLVGVSGSTFIPIFLSIGTTTATSVQGNTITAIAMSGATNGTSSSAPFRGVYVSSGLSTIGNVTGNTIGSITSTGAITYTSSSSSASDIIGIFNFGSSNWSVSNSNIGGFSVANSSTGASNIYGLRVNTSSSAFTTFQNNTIGGNVAGSMQSTSTATGTTLQGILVTNSSATITGNTIRNFTAAGGTGTTATASVIGISLVGSSVNHTISQNTIFNLSNTNTSAVTVVTGIQYTATSGTNIIERNFIYALTAATNSTSAEINGIRVAGGTSTYRNNMIALGAGVSNAITITGINEPSSGTDNIFHNSIYIGGTATSGSGNSFAFNSLVTSNTRNYRDNIFSNVRSNSGATGKNYAIQVGGSATNPSGLTINNNIYYVNGSGATFGRFNSADVTDLTAWKAAIGQDLLSGQIDPQFSNPSGATPDLHLSTTLATPAENNGVDVGVVDDFDGQIRASLTPVDIGADAGNYTPLDIFAPTISYSPLSSNACTTGRVVSPVVITDERSGINVASGTKPRIYYKKTTNANTYAGNTSSDNGWKYVEANNTSSPFNFTIDYSKLTGGSVSTGDTIQYFVIAQDLASSPHVTINNGTLNSLPASVALTSAAFPITGTINYYKIIATGGGIAGSVTIGSTGTYTNLTGSSGLFNDINNQGLTGNLTATIIDPTITETGTIALNSVANVGCSAGPFSVTIKPQASLNSTLSGTSSGAIIKFNGADNVIIDGSNNGTSSKNLTIINTSTATSASVIWIGSASATDGANNDTIRNCTIAGGLNTGTVAGVIAGSGTTFGSAGEAPNSNNTVSGNTFTAVQNGIYINGALALDQNWLIDGNTFGSTSVAADKLGYRGMAVLGVNNFTISNNIINGVITSTTSTATGISIFGNSTNGNIFRNKISDIKNTNTGGYGSNGIALSGSASPANISVHNNFVSDVAGYGYSLGYASGDNGYGIILISGGGYNIYHNSVLMNTSQSVSGNPAALNITSGITSPSTLTIRNNIFANIQTVGTNYAVVSNAPAGVLNDINYNDYYSTGATLGYFSANVTSLAAWRTATGKDAQSISVAPVFISTTVPADLHLSAATGNNWCLNNSGSTLAAVATDIDGQTRSTPPDIGADEFIATDNTTVAPTTQTICSGTAITSIAPSGIASSFSWTRDNTASVTGIAASGTGNISGTLTNTTTAPVTVTFTITPLNASGCSFNTASTVSVVVNPIPDITSTPLSQTVCTGNAITTIVNSSNVTGAVLNWTRDNTTTVTGLANTGSANISGTPVATTGAPVTVTYTVTPTYTNAGITCTGSASNPTVTVVPNNTIALSSAASTTTQTLCINTPITNITYATTIATGATVTGLPTGVTGVWAGNVVTISGTPSVSGTFNYTVTLTGGCSNVTATGTITVTPNNTITLSSPTGTDAQTLCINTGLANITYATTGATNATFSGLPTGVTGTWSGNVATISGTPSVSGTFNYTINLTGGCGTISTFGTINVTPDNTVTLSSVPATTSQSICINTPLTNITYTTTGATGATFSGLPSGVTGTWASNTATISGSPSVSGTFPYTVTLTGGCGTITATGTISVTSANTIALTSGTGTNIQSLCINTAITDVTYATSGATGATVTGLPIGVTGSWAANVVTITGTPTVSGTFNYTVTLTGGCGSAISASGTITVRPNNTVSLSSAAATTNQTLCINTAITNITYNTTGATGATFSGLPAGVAGTWSSNVVTISGSPSVSGTFPYTVTLTGGCSTVTATGTITVNPNNAISLTSGTGSNNPTLCINTTLSSITYSTVGGTGATFSGLPTGVSGVWSANTVTISGTPSVSGTFPYTVTLTGGPGCGGTVSATGTITVNPNNTIVLSSAASTTNQTLCINTPISSVTYTTTRATGASFTGLPVGVTGTWASNTVTISGTPTVSGTFNYTVTLTGGCGTITATGTINVTPNNTITLVSGVGTNAQTRCINTPITNIVYVTTTATGATFSGLPTGVSGTWANNIVTISGTPSVVGTFPYTVTLTGGCSNVSISGTITVNPNNTITLSSAASTTSQTRCALIPITPITYTTTSATGATFSGLPAGVTGSWASNTVTISGAPTASGTFNYTVTLTGGCGNITATGTITVNPLPPVSISPTTAVAICAGAGATLTASGATSYTWTPTATLNTSTGPVVIATPSVGTTYTVTGTDNNGCVNTASRFVQVLGLPNVNIFPTNPQTICPGQSLTLTATGASTYSWTPSATLSSSTGAVVTATPPVTTTYTVTGTAANGCVSTATRTVSVYPRPSSDITPGGYYNICQYDSVTLTAQSGYINYVWMIYGARITPAQSNTLTTGIGGYYTLTVTDSNNCSTTTSQPTIVTVIQRPIPHIERNGISLGVDTTYLTYQWFLNGKLIPGATAQTYTPVQGGAYTVAVKDDTANNCPGFSEAYIYTGLGVNRSAAAEQIRLYPNPASDIVKIDAPVAVNVMVTTMEGKVVYIGTDVKELSTASWVDGIYQIIIRDSSGAYLKTEKLTKINR